jgi:hypothetical protein
MDRVSHFIAALIFLASASGCSAQNIPAPTPSPPASPAGEPLVSAGPLPTFDELSGQSGEEGAVREAYRVMSELRFNAGASPHSAPYRAIFGYEPDSLANYLAPRVHYVFSMQNDVPGLGVNTEIGTYATNIGSLLWLLQLQHDTPAPLTLHGQPVTVESSRVGIIQLGPEFTRASATRIDRISTLLHEARHSDCVSGLGEEDMKWIRQGYFRQIDPMCMFMHTRCPAGHDLEGIPVCENQVWGPYAMELLFNRVLDAECTNCTEKDRQAARIMAIETGNRVENAEALLRGELGPADLGHRITRP